MWCARVISLVIMLAAVSMARAAVQFGFGSVHASASWQSPYYGSGGSSPSDVSLTGSTWHGASQSASSNSPDGGTASASTRIDMGPTMTIGGGWQDVFDIWADVRGFKGGFGSNVPIGGGNASGSVTFVEDSVQTFRMTGNEALYYYSGQILIKDAANATVMSRTFPPFTGGGPFQQFFSLSPGTHTLSWNISSSYMVGTGGSGGFNAYIESIPEPASVALVVAGALLLARRRRM